MKTIIAGTAQNGVFLRMSLVCSEGCRLCACVRAEVMISGDMRWIEGKEGERDKNTCPPSAGASLPTS